VFCAVDDYLVHTCNIAAYIDPNWIDKFYSSLRILICIDLTWKLPVLFIAINIDEGSSLKNKKNGNQLFSQLNWLR